MRPTSAFEHIDQLRQLSTQLPLPIQTILGEKLMAAIKLSPRIQDDQARRIPKSLGVEAVLHMYRNCYTNMPILSKAFTLLDTLPESRLEEINNQLATLIPLIVNYQTNRKISSDALIRMINDQLNPHAQLKGGMSAGSFRQKRFIR